MPTQTTLPINPDVLSWARLESGYGIDRVAHRLGTKEDRVHAWERGEVIPTLRQVQQLAALFHRPLGVFFQPKPPKIPPIAADYRRLPGVEPGHESPEMRFAVRQMVTRRERMINLLGELGEDIPEFSLVASLRERPEVVAHRLRAALGIPVKVQLRWRNEWEALNGWRSKAEQLGLLVFQFSKVDLEEARGISLIHFPLPVVGVNSKERPESKLFTLLHEVAHLMLAAGREEAPALSESRNDAQWSEVERFAESVASHVVIPDDSLAAEVPVASPPNRNWGLNEVREIARRYKVSPLAMATRLRMSGRMTWPQYQAWRRAWDMHLTSLPPPPKGFAAPVDKSMTRNGRPFTRAVLEAMDSNRLTAVEASRYLELRFEHFQKMREKLLSGMQSESHHD